LLKNEIEKKFKTNNWIQIVIESEAYGFIWKDEIIDTTSKQIIDSCINENSIFNTKELKIIILNSYREICKHYKELYIKNKAQNLQYEEVCFINFKHQGLRQLEICNSLKISIGRYEVLEDTILLKLKESNWFRAIRLAYLYGILAIDTANLTSTLNHNIKKMYSSKKRYNLSQPIQRADVFNKTIKCIISTELQILQKKY
jgi:hypothetical protein